MDTKPNVYDFDRTVVYFDSGSQFILFCLQRHFFRMARHMPRIFAALWRFRRGTVRGEAVKGEYYRFLPSLPDWREDVRLFWEEKEESQIKSWYLARLRPDDIIISCSPDFLLQPLCDGLGVRLIATRVDLKTGRLDGFSCYGEEKVRRLQQAYGQIEIGEFYSDSLADAPLAKLARKAFLVKGDERKPWPIKNLEKAIDKS